MTHQPTHLDLLRTEIEQLRTENQQLSAQLNYHRRIFTELRQSLLAVQHTQDGSDRQAVFQRLMSENTALRNQLKVGRLSNRELEIFDLIVQGKTSRDIAADLKISKFTVDTHRKNIQQKLDVSSTAEMIKMSNGL